MKRTITKQLNKFFSNDLDDDELLIVAENIGKDLNGFRFRNKHGRWQVWFDSWEYNGDLLAKVDVTFTRLKPRLWKKFLLVKEIRRVIFLRKGNDREEKRTINIPFF